MTKLAFIATFVTAIGFAAADGAPPHHMPPKEALDACANAKAADKCSFKLHDHDINGTCQERHDDATKLVCRPPHPPHHRGPGAGSGSDQPAPQK